MKNNICCFAGHSELYDTENISKSVKKEAENLIVNHGVIEFMVGNYGTFDSLAASCVRELKEKYPHV